MALYTEISADELANILAQDAEEKKRKALEQYNAQKAKLDNNYNTGGLGGFLGSIVGGIGKGIGDIGKGVYDLIGSGVASTKDLLEGKAGTQENLKAFKKDLYNTDSMKDAYAKSAGTALNAATTLATTAVPGLGAGGAAAKALGGVGANTVAGALGGVADELQQQGENANLESAANRAISGAVGGLVGGKVAGAIGNAKTSSKLGNALLNNKLATSTIGRGAIAGAAGGATGAGTSAALGGGDILGSAIQGATSGAISGAGQSALMAGANKALQGAKNKLGIETEVKTPKQLQETTASDDGVSTDYVEARKYASKTKQDNMADALDNTGKYLQGAQAALNKSDKKAIGVKDTGRFIDGVRKKTGIDVLSKQADFAKEITGGADSILDTVQRNALAYDKNGKPFYADTSDIFNGIDGVLRDSKVTGSALGGRQPRDKFVQDLRNDLVDSNGDLLSLASSWHDTAATLRKSDAKGAKIQAKVYETMARKVEDASYAKIPQENVDSMFDVASLKLREQAKIARQNGNNPAAKAYENTAKALDETPHTIKDFRSFKEDFVKVNKIYDKVLENENGGSVRMARGIRGALNTAKDMLLEKPLYYGASKIGGALSTAGNAIRNSSSGSGNGSGTPNTTRVQTQPMSTDTLNLLGNFIARTEANRQANNNVQNARSAQDYQNLEDQLSANVASIDAEYAPQLQALQTQTISPAQQQLADIANGMNLALAAGDLDSYNKLASLYKTAYSMYELQNPSTETTQLSTAEKNQMAKLESAGNALDQLESLYTKAGGGQGIIGGNIANFLGGLGLNSDVNTYNQLAQGLINQIGAAIGKTDSLNTEGEVQRALSLVPKITDDAQTAKNKLASLRSLLQTNTQTYNELYGA